MSYFIDDENEQVGCEGDDWGWSWIRRNICTQPAGAKRAMFVGRWWYDPAASASAYWYAKGWNHTNALGLSFDGTMPAYPDATISSGSGNGYKPTGFFGRVTNGYNAATAYAISTGPDVVALGYHSTTFPRVRPGSYYTNPYIAYVEQYSNWMDGLGATKFYGSNMQASGSSWNMDLPASPTLGAQFTAAWEIWASNINKTMYARICVNTQSLQGEDMFNAFDTPAGSSLYQWQLHGDVTSAYRIDQNTCVFPTWFLTRFSLPTGKVVVDVPTLQMRFWDWDDNILE